MIQQFADSGVVTTRQAASQRHPPKRDAPRCRRDVKQARTKLAVDGQQSGARADDAHCVADRQFALRQQNRLRPIVAEIKANLISARNRIRGEDRFAQRRFPVVEIDDIEICVDGDDC